MDLYHCRVFYGIIVGGRVNIDVLHINRPSKSGTSYNELRVSAKEEKLYSQVGPKYCTNKQPI